MFRIRELKRMAIRHSPHALGKMNPIHALDLAVPCNEETMKKYKGMQLCKYHEETGWCICAEIHADGDHVWIAGFEAYHDTLGDVWGNLHERCVWSTTDAGYKDVCKHHAA
jgi:hypothetical protein